MITIVASNVQYVATTKKIHLSFFQIFPIVLFSNHIFNFVFINCYKCNVLSHLLAIKSSYIIALVYGFNKSLTLVKFHIYGLWVGCVNVIMQEKKLTNFFESLFQLL